MPMHIDEIHTQVELAPERARDQADAPPATPLSGPLLQQVRALLQQQLRDEQRTRARGNSD